MVGRTRRAFKGLDVVVVGDGVQAAKVCDLLRASGSARSVTLCEGMQAALAQLARTRCEVIVFDLRDTAGLDAIARLRAVAPDTPVVAVLTADDEAVLQERAFACGVHDCVTLASPASPAAQDATVLAYALRCAALEAKRSRERRTKVTELRVLFDLGAHSTWVFDPVESKLLAANRAAVDTYGYSEDEFRSMPLAALRGPMSAPDAQDSASVDLPASGTTVIERHKRKDGGDIEVELSAQTVPLWGRPLRLLQARDVTAERRAMRGLEASERRFRDFFEHSTGFICIHDLDGTLLSVNPAGAAALDRRVAEMLGTPLRDLAPPELRFQVDNYLTRVTTNGEDAGYMRVQTRHGTRLVWQYRNRLYLDADGTSYVMGYAQDITALRAAEQALRLNERRLRTIADTLPLKIAYLDAKQRIVFANEAYRLTYAPDGSEIIGMSAREVLGEQRYAQRLPFIERAFRGERVVFEHEEGEDGSYACMEVTFIPELPENGTTVIGVHVMMQDVTAKKREEQRLTRLARIDDLTGVLNRASFYEHLDNAVARSRDQDSLLAVFYLDIDHFKQVNDAHGHAAGDALICAFAMRLTDKVRASDVVARLGGDEFAIMMEGVRDAEHIRSIALQLVASMQRPFELRDVQLTLSVGTSIGIALCRGGPFASSELVARADAMLYEAKQAGRGTYRLASFGATDAVSDQHTARS